MPLDLIAELEAVVDAFEREGVPYAVCGGIALALHGHPRATMDIDLLIPAEHLAAAMQVASKLDPETGELLSLDLLVVGASFETVWADRMVAAVGARRMVVVSRGGLAMMKRIAGRPQDLADLAALEGTTDDDSA